MDKDGVALPEFSHDQIAMEERPKDSSAVSMGSQELPQAEDDFEDAEGARLLSNTDEPQYASKSPPRRSKVRRVSNSQPPSKKKPLSRISPAWAAVFFVSSVLCFLVAPSYLPELYHHHSGMVPNRDVRLSNGTHEFRKTVLMVSIDGLRSA